MNQEKKGAPGPRRADGTELEPLPTDEGPPPQPDPSPPEIMGGEPTTPDLVPGDDDGSGGGSQQG